MKKQVLGFYISLLCCPAINSVVNYFNIFTAAINEKAPDEFLGAIIKMGNLTTSNNFIKNKINKQLQESTNSKLSIDEIVKKAPSGDVEEINKLKEELKKAKEGGKDVWGAFKDESASDKLAALFGVDTGNLKGKDISSIAYGQKALKDQADNLAGNEDAIINAVKNALGK